MKLEGLRVIDLSLFLPGPYLTLMLADHGAEVIKVEPPGEGDPTRHLGPRDGGETVYFRNLNRGKKSVVVDLKNPQDREALLKLCDTADVFVESFRPGVVDRLGVGYEALRARNPRIVYCSISAFGQQGPYRDRPAHDLAVEALSGVLSITLGQDARPAIPGLPLADLLASLHGLAGADGVAAAAEDRQGRLHRHRDARLDACRYAQRPQANAARIASQCRPSSAAARRSTASTRPPTAATSRSAARNRSSCATCSARSGAWTLRRCARSPGRTSSR
jgi:crotonobetainyl-CoA:carnitine CoA-transferase CaiB-like acyl-CoA transferase